MHSHSKISLLYVLVFPLSMELF